MSCFHLLSAPPAVLAALGDGVPAADSRPWCQLVAGVGGGLAAVGSSVTRTVTACCRGDQPWLGQHRRHCLLSSWLAKSGTGRRGGEGGTPRGGGLAWPDALSGAWLLSPGPGSEHGVRRGRGSSCGWTVCSLCRGVGGSCAKAPPAQGRTTFAPLQGSCPGSCGSLCPRRCPGGSGCPAGLAVRTGTGSAAALAGCGDL